MNTTLFLSLTYTRECERMFVILAFDRRGEEVFVFARVFSIRQCGLQSFWLTVPILQGSKKEGEWMVEEEMRFLSSVNKGILCR